MPSQSIAKRLLVSPFPRYALIFTIFFLTVLGTFRGFRLLSKTSFDLSAPAKSSSGIALEKLVEFFPEVAAENMLITVVIKCQHPNVCEESLVLGLLLKN